MCLDTKAHLSKAQAGLLKHLTSLAEKTKQLHDIINAFLFCSEYLSFCLSHNMSLNIKNIIDEPNTEVIKKFYRSSPEHVSKLLKELFQIELLHESRPTNVGSV